MRGQSTAKPTETSSPPPEIRGPIDMAQLSRQTLGDHNLELEAPRLVDEMSHTYYSRLESSTTVEELLVNLHTLKGAAAGIGACGLAELARVTETELKAGAPVNPERIDDLHVAVEELSVFIAQRLKHAA